MTEQIEQLKQQIKQLDFKKSAIETKIKEQTEQLQVSLKAVKVSIKQKQQELKTLTKAELTNTDIHIVTRFYYWYHSSIAEISDWIIKDGAMRQHIFNDEHRYSPVDIQERLCDYLSDFSIDIFDGNISHNEYIFNKLPSSTKEQITAILEDAINQNISSCTWDW